MVCSVFSRTIEEINMKKAKSFYKNLLLITKICDQEQKNHVFFCEINYPLPDT